MYVWRMGGGIEYGGVFFIMLKLVLAGLRCFFLMWPKVFLSGLRCFLSGLRCFFFWLKMFLFGVRCFFLNLG